jgi:nucleotide-binding universal stress UspA family protein
MRALIAVDGSEAAESVVAAIVPWLRSSQADADLLTVRDASEVRETTRLVPDHDSTPQGAEGLFGRTTAPAPTAEDRGQAMERTRREIELRLERLAKLYLADVPHSLHVVSSDDTAAAIVEHAKATQADLVVMGTHGRTGLRRVVMGSVAEAALRTSPVPLFLVREGMRAAGEIR